MGCQRCGTPTDRRYCRDCELARDGGRFDDQAADADCGGDA